MAGSVSVVTVTYNSAHVVNAALAPFSPEREVICVDNASSDGLEQALDGLNVRLIRNSANVGFGRACNQGLSEASGEFVLFINPDVRVDGSTLPALLDAAQRYPDCGVFLPLTRRADGSLWIRNRPAGSSFKGRSREDIRHIGGDFCGQFLDGSIFLVRRSLFQEIGGFDENIFLYYEDDDLSRRLSARKAPIILVKDAYASHSAGMSVAGGFMTEVLRSKFKKMSEIYYLRKYGINYSILLDFSNVLMKILIYAITFNVSRLSGALGKFLGILSHIAGRAY
jgi:N-acetylglucosaminyl-diphospho-decaprenol L-rhamnosyltransferase